VKIIEKLGFTEQDYEIYKDCFKGNLLKREIVSKDDIYQKHDKTFKTILKDMNEMYMFLKVFVGLEISKKNVEIYNTNFITKDFHRRESDIICKQSNENTYYIIEHQSRVDNDMPRRLLEYCVELMREVKQNKNIVENPLIIPIVIYTGDRKWNVPTIFSDTQKCNYKNKIYAINNLYKLIDKNKYSIQDLKRINSKMSKMLLLEKCKYNKELVEMIKYFATNARTEDEKKWVNDIVYYVFNKMLKEMQKEEIVKIIKKKEGNVMDDLIERIKENEKRKEKKILEKGMEKGMEKGKIETAKRMLKENVSIDSILKFTGLTRKEILKIK